MTKIIKRPLLAATGFVLAIATIWMVSWVASLTERAWIGVLAGATGTLVLKLALTLIGIGDDD